MTEEARKLRRRNLNKTTEETEQEHSTCQCACKELLESINKKLDVAIAAAKEVTELKERLTNQETKINDLEESLSVAQDDVAALKTEVDELNDYIKTNFNQSLDQLSFELSAERNRAVKLESHSRRNNLRFYNISQENRNETYEDSEKKVRDFINKELSAGELAHSITIERAHRVGHSKPQDTKPKPLIVKFAFYKEKEMVKSLANKLKGKSFGISDDFPKEVLQVRKNLLPVLKKAKQEGKKASLRYDNLFIEGQRYTGHEAYKPYALRTLDFDSTDE